MKKYTTSLTPNCPQLENHRNNLKHAILFKKKTVFQLLWNCYLKHKQHYLMLIIKVLHYLGILRVELKTKNYFILL